MLLRTLLENLGEQSLFPIDSVINQDFEMILHVQVFIKKNYVAYMQLLGHQVCGEWGVAVERSDPLGLHPQGSPSFVYRGPYL